MYKVYWTDPCGQNCGEEFTDLTLALQHTEFLRGLEREFVCLVSELKDCVTKPGVDAVINGLLPDGTDYTWRKRR